MNIERFFEMPRREQLAWAAGFFDGEGSIGVYKQRKHLVLHSDIGQVSREVLDQFNHVVGVGNVTGPYTKKNPNHSPQFSWDVTGFEKTQYMVVQLWNWLSPVKRADAKHFLNIVRQYYVLCDEAKPEFAARYLQERVVRR